jgi:hypothetical protein
MALRAAPMPSFERGNPFDGCISRQLVLTGHKNRQDDAQRCLGWEIGVGVGLEVEALEGLAQQMAVTLR